MALGSGAHISGYLSAVAAGAPGRPLLHCDDRVTSASEAAARVAALSAVLSARLALAPGERVSLATLATDHSLEALLAVFAAGGVAAPLNWRWQTEEAAYAVDLVGASILIADPACLSLAMRLAGCCASLRAVVLLGQRSDYADGRFEAAFARFGVTASGAGSALPQLLYAEDLMAEAAREGASLSASSSSPMPLQAPPDGAALIVFTSGSTGQPKGVVLSHTALHVQSMAKLVVCGYSSTDVYLHAPPLFHIAGISSALAMLLVGARHVFLPRFDPAAALELMRRHGVTSFVAVPAMVADLAGAAHAARLPPLPTVQRLLLGGGGTSPALVEAMKRLLPEATVLSAYGMTETAATITFAHFWSPPGSDVSRSSSASAAAAAAASADDPAAAAAGVYVGRPSPGVELAIYQLPEGWEDAATSDNCSREAAAGGRIVQQGSGEVLTRGPHVLLRYWADPAATAAAMLPGGWMRTGDLGYLGRGELWLLGRAKDMIKSGGENVHAWEVERALASHPAVAMTAVVGVPHWRLGEAVAAAVVLAPGWSWAGPSCQSLLLPPPGAGAAAGGQERSPGNSSSRSSGDYRTVDSRLLQQHCRDTGLTAFKLPRAFLLCSPPAALASSSSGAEGSLHPFPVTSTGKPAKHLLRSLMATQVAAAEEKQQQQQPRARL